MTRIIAALSDGWTTDPLPWGDRLGLIALTITIVAIIVTGGFQ